MVLKERRAYKVPMACLGQLVRLGDQDLEARRGRGAHRGSKESRDTQALQDKEDL